MNLKVLGDNIGGKETRFLVQQESRLCKCILYKNVPNSKQKWNHCQ